MYRSSFHSDKPYVPKGIDEIMDLLASMMLFAPTFKDKIGYSPERNIDTEFFALNEGLRLIRYESGEENYKSLSTLSDKMRAHFEADPENKTGDTVKGRNLIMEMEDLLTAIARRKKPTD